MMIAKGLLGREARPELLTPYGVLRRMSVSSVYSLSPSMHGTSPHHPATLRNRFRCLVLLYYPGRVALC